MARDLQAFIAFSKNPAWKAMKVRKDNFQPLLRTLQLTPKLTSVFHASVFLLMNIVKVAVDRLVDPKLL